LVDPGDEFINETLLFLLAGHAIKGVTTNHSMARTDRSPSFTSKGTESQKRGLQQLAAFLFNKYLKMAYHL
jgi:hypothetical protein